MSEAAIDKDPPDGTPGTPGTPGTTEEPIAEPQLEELSPTERQLESLRGKLTGQKDTVSGEKERAQRALAETRTNIDDLKQRVAELEKDVLRSHATLNQAMGLAFALQSTVKGLREQETGEREGSGVGELRNLIATEKARVREVAVMLVGDNPYTDEFLNSPNPAIDEGKASGLVFEIRNTLQGTVADRRTKQTQTAGNRVARRDPEYDKKEAAYREAEIHFENALADLSSAEIKRDSLLEQVRHSLQTIQALEEAIKTADRVAVRIEEQGQRHERIDMTQAGQKFDDTKGAHEQAKLDLATAESHRAALEPVLAEFIKTEERLTETIGRVIAVPAVYSRAHEVHENVLPIGQRLLRIKGELNAAAEEARQSINPAIYKIGDVIQERIYETLGYWKNEGDNAFDELEKATVRLAGLLKALETACTLADASEPTENLDWDAVSEVFRAADELDRFLNNEWPRLAAGTLENAEAIATEARARLEETLQPLAVLRKACEEVSRKPLQAAVAPTAAAAPVAVVTDAAFPDEPGESGVKPLAPAMGAGVELDVEFPPEPEVPVDLSGDAAAKKQAGPATGGPIENGRPNTPTPPPVETAARTTPPPHKKGRGVLEE